MGWGRISSGMCSQSSEQVQFLGPSQGTKTRRKCNDRPEHIHEVLHRRESNFPPGLSSTSKNEKPRRREPDGAEYLQAHDPHLHKRPPEVQRSGAYVRCVMTC